MRGCGISYSPKELAWIERHRTTPRREAHVRFCRRFNRDDVSLDHFKALCTRKGWGTGRTGRFSKGVIPHNLGMKMPFNVNSARTQFKKGVRRGIAVEVYKPIGTERITVDGYVERKIHDGLPLQRRWRAVHLINWEALYGPLPKGHCLKCLNGDKRNTDPSNWTLISRRMQPFLNGHRGPNYDQAVPEVKPAILTLAKLKVARFSRGKMDGVTA
jgi:hypothetical protein